MSILKVVFSGDTTQLDKALTKAQSGLDNFSKKAKDVGGKMSVFITAPIVAAGGAAIKFASDFEESLNKVDVAFKGSSSQVKAFAKTALNSFGIAEGSALDMAALFGDMSTSMGISQGEAAKLSTSLVGLAGDLASFKNMNIEEVTTALNGVFTGETESLKRLGVVMTEANLQQFALSQGMKGNIKDFTQAQKVMLRYEYVMSMTSNAHGDFIRTGGGAANQMRVFQEGLKELGVLFGQEMLPLFTDMVKSLNDLIKRFKELSPETKKTILIVAGITAAMGPLLMVIGSMASGLSAVISGLRMAIPVLTKFGTVLAGVNLAAAGVATAVGVGLTKTVAVIAVPEHPLAVGVIVNVTVTAAVVVFVNVPLILPLPDAAMPVTVAVLFLVQAYVVPLTAPVKAIVVIGVALHTVCAAGVAITKKPLICLSACNC